MASPVRRTRRSSSRSSSPNARPSHRTSPASGSSNPPSMPRNVVFPEPLGPITSANSRRGSENETSRTAATLVTPGYVRDTARASRSGASAMTPVRATSDADLVLGHVDLELRLSERERGLLRQPHAPVLLDRFDRDARVADAAVAQVHDAIGSPRGEEVVRRHHDRGAEVAADVVEHVEDARG